MDTHTDESITRALDRVAVRVGTAVSWMKPRWVYLWERDEQSALSPSVSLYLGPGNLGHMNENTISPTRSRLAKRAWIGWKEQRTCRLSCSFLAPALGARSRPTSLPAPASRPGVRHLSLRLYENQIIRSTTFQLYRQAAVASWAEQVNLSFRRVRRFSRNDFHGAVPKP